VASQGSELIQFRIFSNSTGSMELVNNLQITKQRMVTYLSGANNNGDGRTDLVVVSSQLDKRGRFQQPHYGRAYKASLTRCFSQCLSNDIKAVNRRYESDGLQTGCVDLGLRNRERDGNVTVP
jgi:hypothetical protein